MAKAEKVDVTPPVEPVYEVVLRLSEQEAKDLVVVLGLLPCWGTTGRTIAGAFNALEQSGYRYVDIRNGNRDTGEDRYQAFHNWVTALDGGDRHG